MANFGGDDDRIMEAKESLILTKMEGNVKVWSLGEWKSNDPYQKSLQYWGEKSITKGCFMIGASSLDHFQRSLAVTLLSCLNANPDAEVFQILNMA